MAALLEQHQQQDGSVVIPGKLLTDLARLLPDPEVTIEYKPEEGVAQVTSGSASYRLNTYAAEDFPRLPALEAQLHEIDREALGQFIADQRAEPGSDAQHLVPLREEQVAELTIAWPAMRRAVSRIGEALASGGAIAEPDDVFSLTRAEALSALGDSGPAPRVDVAARNPADFGGLIERAASRAA